MPRISEFFGLAIYMYWFDTDRHNLPHFHVRYQGQEWVYGFDGLLLSGRKHVQINNLIQSWCKIRHLELEDAWQKAIKGEPLPWIKPLN